jgi:hypothetical protein
MNRPAHPTVTGDSVNSAGGRPRVLVIPILLILFLLISCHDVWAQARKPTEYEVKAAYLYNFGKFVRWPATPATADAFLVCVLGKNPFGSALDATVNGESIEGKHLTVRYITTATETSKCRILFVSGSEDSRLDTILAALSKHPVLTVSDIPDFVDRGGDIEFVQQGEKIRFKVNLAATEQAGLVLSSDLLKVAVSVKRNGQSGE